MTSLAAGTDGVASTVATKIAERLAEAPDDLVLVHYGEEQWTAARLRLAVAELRDSFPASPDRPLRIAAVLRNRPWHIAVIAAVLGQGHCVILLSQLEPTARTVGDVQSLRPDVVVAERDDLSADLLAVAAECGAITVELPAVGEATAVVVSGAWSPGPDLLIPPGVAVLMLTSGTTGPAKRVPVRFADLDNAIEGAERHYVGKVMTERRRQPSICPLPPVTISGLWALVTALVGGAPLVLLDRFDAEAWSHLVARHQPRTAGLPPAALRMILQSEIPPDRLVSLTSIWCGAAPLDPALGSAFEARYGVPVLQSYGATEFTGGLAGWSLPDWKKWSEQKRGSVGRLHDGVHGRVVDPVTGEDQPAGASGLLAFRTPHSVGADAEAWIQTNDLGRIDEDGFLFVEGRADDVINRGGFKVSAATLKSLLENHPGVAEAAVVPLPDARLGHVPGVLVVTRPEATVTIDELTQLVRDSLPPYYVPAVMRFAAELPRNGAMKIVRPAVLEALTGH